MSTEEKVFEIQLIPFDQGKSPQTLYAKASDWFSALRDGLPLLRQTLEMTNLDVSLSEDGESGKIIDPNTAYAYEFETIPKERWQTEQVTLAVGGPRLSLAEAFETCGLNVFLLAPRVQHGPEIPWRDLLQPSLWWEGLKLFYRYAWLLLPIGLLCGGGVYALLHILKMPTQLKTYVPLVVGLEGILWVWIGLASFQGMREYLSRVHWQYAKLRMRGWKLLLIAFGISLGYLWFSRTFTLGIWLHTFVSFAIFALFLYSVFCLASSSLLSWEIHGAFDPGSMRRLIAPLITVLLLSFSASALLVFDFVGGMYYWYYAYVNKEMRVSVHKRQQELKSLQLKTLHDKHGKYLGMLAKSQSDWSPHYNDPKLLKWKVSRAIMRAEGIVQALAWWWSYLPDGKQLLCEPFSLQAFLRVPYYFLKQRRKVGGSTPALQAAKNFMDFGSSRRGKRFLQTLHLKLFDELPRSYIMSQAFTPREMLATYMATLWAGYSSNYGLHRMSLYYFGVEDPSQLSWNQAIVLASSLPNPGHLNPWYLQSCRQGKCASKARTRAYATWNKRIDQIKRKFRRQGIKIPKELPTFRNGIRRLRVISRKWDKHDSHLRTWLQRELQQRLPRAWDSSTLQLGYDRQLTVGTSKKKHVPTAPKTPSPTSKRAQKGKKKPTLHQDGLISIVNDALKGYREHLPALQIAYTLYNAQDGMISSQYGGDLYYDLSTAKRPVVGSTFKVLTMTIAGYWPDALPIYNRGHKPPPTQKDKTRKKRRFLYQQLHGSKGTWVRNSHTMPAYVSKRSALRMSANIAFVLLSLRWTWFVEDKEWKNIFHTGLLQLFQDRKKYTLKQARRAVKRGLADPKALENTLKQDLGFAPYMLGLRKQAVFEAAKAATIKQLLKSRRVSKHTLARFIDAHSVQGFPKALQGVFYGHRHTYILRFRDPANRLEVLSWCRALRMEIGLRYIIHLGTKILQYNPKEDHLLPVMTMTLGVNNANTKQLASLAGFVSAQRISYPRLIRSVWRGPHRRRLRRKHPQLPTLPSNTLPTIKQAMNDVLRWGTAGRAGRLVAQQHGHKVLKESGAKTGTVQNYRGVSCIGFIEHRAGALSIGTPNNRKLRTYHPRRYMTQPIERLKTRIEALQKRIEQKTGSARQQARRQKQLERLTKQRDAYKEKLDTANKLAQTFLRMPRKWRTTERRSEYALQRAARYARGAQIQRRLSTIYQKYARGDARMITLYQKWFERFKAYNERRVANSKIRADKSEQQALQAWQQFENMKRQYEFIKEQSAIAILRARHKKQKASFLKAKTRYNQILRKITHKNARVMRKKLAEMRRLRRALLKKIRKTLTRLRFAIRQLRSAKRQMRRAELRAKRAQSRQLRAAKHKAKIIEQVVKKTKSFRRNRKRLAHNQKRRERWLKASKQALQRSGALLERRKQALIRSATLKTLAKKQKQAYDSMQYRVHKTHKRWSMNSSQACMLLFQLLSYWKHYDAQKPMESRKITLLQGKK